MLAFYICGQLSDSGLYTPLPRPVQGKGYSTTLQAHSTHASLLQQSSAATRSKETAQFTKPLSTMYKQRQQPPIAYATRKHSRKQYPVQINNYIFCSNQQNYQHQPPPRGKTSTLLHVTNVTLLCFGFRRTYPVTYFSSQARSDGNGHLVVYVASRQTTRSASQISSKQLRALLQVAGLQNSSAEISIHFAQFSPVRAFPLSFG